MKGFGKLLICSPGIGKKKIVANGSAHQCITLLYIHDMRTHAGSFYRFTLGIIQYNLSAIGLDDTRQQAEDGGLATTGFSHYRHRCGRTEIIREMADYHLLTLIGIRIAHILKPDATSMLQRNRSISLRQRLLLFGIFYLYQPVNTR